VRHAMLHNVPMTNYFLLSVIARGCASYFNLRVAVLAAYTNPYTNSLLGDYFQLSATSTSYFRLQVQSLQGVTTHLRNLLIRRLFSAFCIEDIAGEVAEMFHTGHGSIWQPGVSG
jgi:hypothetical protein